VDGAVRPINWLFRLAVTVVAGALLLTGVTVAVAPRVWAVLNAHEQAPIELPSFVALAQRTYVYDSAGNEIAVFQLENSQPVSIAEVPDDVIAAILAVEDAGFYQHEGVNLRALVRALLSNFQSDSARQGASTITQQVVKNEYLAGLERDGRYKLLQARYALLLEKEMSKDEILERYLNTVYFGNNAYGLQAAAEVYFGKTVAQLTLVEGAFLAGLIQAPSSYDPIRRPERSRQRFEVVMRRIAETGLMSESAAEAVGVAWELPEQVQTIPQRTYTRTYFTEAVREYLLDRTTILGETPEERYNALYRGGLRIYTTLDPGLQMAAEQAKRDRLPANAAGIEAAMVSLETSTGAVRAMVGGPGFRPGEEEVNLALRRRQTGSSIKLFILAAAVQAGAQNNDLIDGTRPCTLPNPGDPSQPFTITEGVSRSVSPLEQMTWLSINCAFARLSQIVGLHRLVAMTYRMAASPYLTGDPMVDGNESRPYQIQPYASFATGANEMSAMDMASGAQTIANQGLHMDPYYIDRIDSPRGVLYVHEDPGEQVMTQDAALRTTDILRGVLTRGTARRYPLEGGRPAAGKTGTQENNTNAWFIGFTPQYATAVWVGDPDAYRPMVNIPEFVAQGVSKVQGGTFPAAIWKAYMDVAHVFKPVLDWPAPPANPRPAARLYLPGSECIAQVVSGTVPGDTSVTTTTVAPPPTTPPPTVPGDTTPPTVATTAPPPTVVIKVVDPGTTIAPDNTEPLWPLTAVDPKGYIVFDCAAGPPAGARPEGSEE
jgi:penicillin-binding protein 1A